MDKQQRKRRAAAKKRMRQHVRDRKKQINIHSYGSGKWIKGILIAAMLCFLSVFVLTATDTLNQQQADEQKQIIIDLNVQSETMLAGENLPQLKAKTSFSGDEERTIDADGKYTVKQLLQELNQGEGYELSCEGDGMAEGEFPIQIALKDDLTKKLDADWGGEVKLVTYTGVLTVKNKVGTWDGKKFKRYDGTYVTDDFVESQGSRYYFNSNGDMVTGELKKGYSIYNFDQNGKLVSETNLIDPAKPMVAITYDDGPGKRTNELLDVLEENKAHATFFLLGQKMNNSTADLVKRMAQVGSEAANHSWSHPQLTKKNEEEIKKQMEDTNNSIVNLGGVTPMTFRPPYGAINDMVRANVKMPLILWSVDTLDWKTKDAKATVDHVMNNVKDGDIILMHDVHDSTIDASKELIPKLIEAGYQLVTVSEMAAARGITLEAGQSYTEFWK